MLHKQVGLDATITDAGEFTAIAATWSVDRTNEQIVEGAFADSITAWKAQCRPIPVHWDHGAEAANVIGSVNPTTMAETHEGLRVEGQLDLKTSKVAREAWHSMKTGGIALSFGYMVTADFKREDGVRELLSIDLFEISLAPSPSNRDTRIVSMKSEHKESDELDRFFREVYGDDVPASKGKAKHQEREERPTKGFEEVLEQAEKDFAEVLEKAEKAERRNRPIKIKHFEV